MSGFFGLQRKAQPPTMDRYPYPLSLKSNVTARGAFPRLDLVVGLIYRPTMASNYHLGDKSNGPLWGHPPVN